MSLWFSILLISICAVMWDIGVVFQKKATDEIPNLEVLKHTGKSFSILLHSPKWVVGLVFSALGWGLFAFALNYTPISLARVIQGSGFVILAVFSLLFLNHRLKLLEWVGVIIITIGIIGLGLSQPPDTTTISTIILKKLFISSTIITSIPIILSLIPRIFPVHIKEVITYSVSAGVFLGFGDIFTKSLLITLNKGYIIVGFLIFLPLLAGFYVFGVLFLSKSYQKGRAILVTGISDFFSRIVTIVVGMYGLNEKLPTDIIMRDMRVGGIAVVFIGVLLLSRFTPEEIAEKM